MASVLGYFLTLFYLILIAALIGISIIFIRHRRSSRFTSWIPRDLYLTSRSQRVADWTVKKAKKLSPSHVYSSIASIFPDCSRQDSAASQSFLSDVETGLHSTNFDLSDNIIQGDERTGLDSKAKKAVLKIMNKQKVTFDKARHLFNTQNMARNNIGPDGRPKDPKAVFFN